MFHSNVISGEFNIGDTQGLIETLQKLNSVLSKGRESGQKSLLTNNSGGQFTTEVIIFANRMILQSYNFLK